MFRTVEDQRDLVEQFRAMINKLSIETGSNTPDWILAEYLVECLKAYEAASNRRESWYGYTMEPGQDGPKRIVES